jgi:uncharacterized protein
MSWEYSINLKMKYKARLTMLFVFLAFCLVGIQTPIFAINGVCFDDDCFRVEIAKTRAEMRKGLMYRHYLPDLHGMLFIFPSSNTHTFWMKHTLIPLDIIWLDQNGVVVWVLPNAPPCIVDPCDTYTPPEMAKYVLEINAGMAQKLGIKRGRVMRAYGQLRSSLYY